MKTLRLLGLFFALAAAAFAADATGNWKWTTHSPAGAIETTLKLEVKDGRLAGAYANQFGATTISHASLQGDVIAFDVVRTMGGAKYVVHYHGKLAGDTITGTIEAPGHDGGAAVKLDWTAQRTTGK